MAAASGVCSGRSVALPPQRTITSILSLNSPALEAEKTGVPLRVLTAEGSRRVNTAVKDMSPLVRTADSTPRARFPYPIKPILIISCSFPMAAYGAAE